MYIKRKEWTKNVFSIEKILENIIHLFVCIFYKWLLWKKKVTAYCVSFKVHFVKNLFWFILQKNWLLQKCKKVLLKLTEDTF